MPGKYYQANREMERLVLSTTGISILNDSDPVVVTCSKSIAEKFNHTEKEVARQYRRHCNAVRRADKYLNEHDCTDSEAANLFHVKVSKLRRYLSECRTRSLAKHFRRMNQ